jgi:transcriptional regulator GlxA family with amidase domain
MSKLRRALVFDRRRSGSAQVMTLSYVQRCKRIGVILDQLDLAPALPLQLPTPREPRALVVAQMLLNDPNDRRPLADLCKAAGASKRTIERAFQTDTKFDLRQVAPATQLLNAIRLLAAGET